MLPLLALAVIAAVGLHPRIFTPGIRRLMRPFGGADLPPLPYSTMLGLIVYYCFTWLVGGTALWFLLRSLGGDPALKDIPYLGGVAAVSAIVAVLSLITPSGLGVREASMYGLLVAITPNGVALGATVLNRLTITIVEGRCCSRRRSPGGAGRGRRLKATHFGLGEQKSPGSIGPNGPQKFAEPVALSSPQPATFGFRLRSIG